MPYYENFRNPGPEYRSAPFWSLNDELDCNELVRQIGEMYEQGMGGFFMHPRGGMKTEYLSGEFFHAIKACIDEAGRLGMKAWLYDEDRFPSGGAGGLTTRDRPEYRMKALALTETGDEACKIEVINIPERAFWNNRSYPDLCCKDAVDNFIRITHERYKREAGEYFAESIPGIFSDEPHFAVEMEGRRLLPWSLDFDKVFARLKGYDVMKNLKKLFYPVKDYKKVRFDYWDVLLGMFVQSFTKNVYDWCEKNGLKFTGHFWEHAFPSPTYNASVMPNYEFMHYPGIDMLFNREKDEEQVGNILIVKEASSVANQLGKERVLSETYGASGWELNFSDQKRIADWQFALGVNFICQHLLHYSLKGYRKRDFPPSFLEQPWWKHYKILGDYIGRLSYILSQGEFVADILVMHPSSSTWAEFQTGGDNSETDKIGRSSKQLNNILCQLHYFYDLGDDILMEKHGRVEKDRLYVGKMSYGTVILPSMTLMRSSTFTLLKHFAENGGRIISVDKTPYLLDGEKNKKLVEFFNSSYVKRIENDKDQIKAALDILDNKHAVIAEINRGEAPDIYCHMRKAGGELIYFLANSSKDRKYDTLLELENACYIEEWDAVTGEKREKDIIRRNGRFYTTLEFYPVQSHLLVTDSSRKVTAGNINAEREKPAAVIELNIWKAVRKDYNAYTLKLCRFRLEEGEWSDLTDVLEADGRLGEELGFGQRNIFSKQPWMYTKDECNVKANVKARFVFDVSEIPDGELYAAVESPDEFDVFINGNRVNPAGMHYINRAFILHDIKEHIRCGENDIELVTNRFGINSALESVYIVGDFKLRKIQDGFTLTGEDDEIPAGDWTVNGYPYYSGAMEYSTSFKLHGKHAGEVMLELGQLWMAAAQIKVNGRPLKVLGWEPYQADITAFIKEGGNTVTVEVMNSLQNLLGWHNGEETAGFATPFSFAYGNGDVRFVKSGFEGKGRVKAYEK